LAGETAEERMVCAFSEEIKEVQKGNSRGANSGALLRHTEILDD
jgi:hypothetical protein